MTKGLQRLSYWGFCSQHVNLGRRQTFSPWQEEISSELCLPASSFALKSMLHVSDLSAVQCDNSILLTTYILLTKG